MSGDKQTQLADLLRQAGAAHHTYEQDELKGVYDEEWPTWYADWVINNGLNALLGSAVTVEALAETFKAATDAHGAASSDLDWAAFTAQRVLSAHGQEA